jgi:hypothetical protein
MRLLAFALCVCAACGDDGGDADGGTDSGGGGAPGEPFAVVFEQLDAALISVAGTGRDDVWAVGADMRDGSGALVLRYDGEGWRRELTGVEEDLWWVFIEGPRSAYLGGTGGTILAHDGEQFTRMDTPGSGIVFGIWGAASDELWAVGGEPDIAPGFVWRHDGGEWRDMTAMLPEEAQGGRTLFKVWGRQRDDVWFVGSDGLAVHWDGAGFALGDSDTSRRLFTVHGPPEGEQFVAVGGLGDAVIVEHDDGTQWHNVTTDPAPPELFGVFMVAENEGYAVGAEGTVVRRDGAAWKLLDTGLDLLDPFHAVWVDPDGGVWAVGGDLLTATPDKGMLVHRGEAIANTIDD